jgi:hypothetical protein
MAVGIFSPTKTQALVLRRRFKRTLLAALAPSCPSIVRPITPSTWAFDSDNVFRIGGWSAIGKPSSDGHVQQPHNGCECHRLPDERLTERLERIARRLC